MMRNIVLLLVLAGSSIVAPATHAQDRPRGVAPAPRPPRPPAPGWMGISLVYPVSSEQSRGNGVEIEGVHPGSPAARAGLRKGDRIVQVNGRPATREAILGLRLTPGDTVKLRTRRGRREQNVTVVAAPRITPRVVTLRRGDENVVIRVDTLEALVMDQMRSVDTLLRRLDRHVSSDSVRRRLERVIVRSDSLVRYRRVDPDSVVLIGPDAMVFDLGRRAVAGAEFTEVNPELGGYFGVSQGLLATRVSEGTPAARSGLRSGDVITHAGGKPVRNVAELRAVVRQAGDRKQLPVTIVRQRARRDLTLRW